MKATQPELGFALRTQRELRGEGIRDMAACAGVAKSIVSRVERGRDVQLSTLNKILRAARLELTVTGR